MSRYIDADKLIKFANNTKDKTIDANDIARFPTADVRENVRGEWIDRGKNMTIRWQCSECGRRDTHIYNFCPNCGADMRGDKNEQKND